MTAHRYSNARSLFSSQATGPWPADRLPPALALPDGRLLLPFPRRPRGLSYDEARAAAELIARLACPPPVPCWCCMTTGSMTPIGPTEPAWLARQVHDRIAVRLP